MLFPVATERRRVGRMDAAPAHRAHSPRPHQHRCWGHPAGGDGHGAGVWESGWPSPEKYLGCDLPVPAQTPAGARVAAPPAAAAPARTVQPLAGPRRHPAPLPVHRWSLSTWPSGGRGAGTAPQPAAASAAARPRLGRTLRGGGGAPERDERWGRRGGQVVRRRRLAARAAGFDVPVALPLAIFLFFAPSSPRPPPPCSPPLLSPPGGPVGTRTCLALSGAATGVSGCPAASACLRPAVVHPHGSCRPQGLAWPSACRRPAFGLCSTRAGVLARVAARWVVRPSSYPPPPPLPASSPPLSPQTLAVCCSFASLVGVGRGAWTIGLRATLQQRTRQSGGGGVWASPVPARAAGWGCVPTRSTPPAVLWCAAAGRCGGRHRRVLRRPPSPPLLPPCRCGGGVRLGGWGLAPALRVAPTRPSLALPSLATRADGAGV